MTEQERKQARKELSALAKKAREENRRLGLLLTDRQLDEQIRRLRGA